MFVLLSVGFLKKQKCKFSLFFEGDYEVSICMQDLESSTEIK